MICEENSNHSHQLCISTIDSVNKIFFFQLMKDGKIQIADTLHNSEVSWFDEQHIQIRKYRGYADNTSGRNYSDQIINVNNSPQNEK